ncbi:MAG: tetratricopeptide repeat protein [Desulfovibrionaceae bacterium]|jgi:tetratricopeptide (TPR) repeat protein|nr:tetratricopeptide repeat protein [Desulfovibrionaceae bacterium]
MAVSNDIRIRHYESTVVEYVTKDLGYFISVSGDSTFNSVLRSTLNKQLAIEMDCLAVILDEEQILRAISELSRRRKSVVLFLERHMSHGETSFLVRQIKNAFKNVKIIVLTGETDRRQLVLLHETGADNFIAKPISMNTLIEKIAFTIKPQNKIGQLIEQAKDLVAMGNHEDALKVARQVMELKPGSAAGYLVMGDAYKGMAKRAKAVECYRLASENADMYMEPLKKLAEFYREEGDQEVYLEFLQRLDKLSPLNVERKVEMGEVHVKLGNTDEAEELFETAIAQATREAAKYIDQVTTRIAGIYNESDPAKAETYYRRALEAKGRQLDRADIGTFIHLGINLRRQGRWEEALVEYQRALKVAPDDENIHYNMALAYAEGKRTEQAAQEMQAALEANPRVHERDHVVAYNMGLVFAKSGHLSRAREMLHAALRQAPDYAAALKLLKTLEGR